MNHGEHGETRRGDSDKINKIFRIYKIILPTRFPIYTGTRTSKRNLVNPENLVNPVLFCFLLFSVSLCVLRGSPCLAQATKTTPASLSMPANPAARDVTLTTRLQPTADLRKKDTPQNATLAFALKVGPLPPVTALAFSLDGKILAVGGYRAVILWDTATGKPVTSLVNLAGAVQSITFSATGDLLAVAGGTPGASGEVKVFDTKTFAPFGTVLKGHTDTVNSVAFSADGKRLATASQDKTAKLWEWPSGKELQVFRDHSDAVTRVVFAPDGKSVYTASQDRNVRRFNVDDGKVIRAFSGHTDSATALALSPDGKALLSSGPDLKLRWWNPDDGNSPRQVDGHGGAVNDVVFSKDGKLVASAGADKVVRIWEAGGGGQQRALEGSDDWMYAAAFSPDGKMTAGGGADGIVRIWETANGRQRLLLLAWPPDGKNTKAAEWIALTPEGYFEASTGWATLLRPTLAGKPVAAPRLTRFFTALRQPENITKSLQAAPLEPAKLPDPPAAPPAKPSAEKPAEKSTATKPPMPSGK
jgi:WD40 repeat protein